MCKISAAFILYVFGVAVMPFIATGVGAYTTDLWVGGFIVWLLAMWWREQ